MTDFANQLVSDLASLSGDPLRFVLYSFPWGEPDTELANVNGPEPWQAKLLGEIRDGLRSPDEAIREAVASGHGIGKSTLVAWIILWAISTFEDTRGVVTANTENQLKTKTWVELAKWFRLFIGRELFELTATKICARDPAHADTWRIDMVPWSERNTEAFAGLHNKGRRIVVIFDEASAIPDIIWETTEGALTDSNTQIIWCVFGNPTRNTGRFRECFNKFKNRWKTTQVDSREVSITNKAQIARWIEDYGEDSDFVRVRVRGIFPRAGELEFISLELALEASRREVFVHPHDPFIIGVDVARFGGNESVIYFRKGLDARTFQPLRFTNIDTMSFAGRIAEEFARYHADALFVDEGGVGGGVVDRLRQLQVPVWPINFGSKADRANISDANLYANKRSEMWGFMREWLRAGAIPDNQDLIDQLIAPHYGFNNSNAIQLERKDDMRRRGAASPDIADALALTFAYPVMKNISAGGPHMIDRPTVETEYNPFEEARLVA